MQGEIRDIMNTVLIAEKRLTNIITRGKRWLPQSLLQPAKLMDENQALYKLKELARMLKGA